MLAIRGLTNPDPMEESSGAVARNDQDHEHLAESTAQVDEMEQDTESAVGLLDFSSVFPVCVARKAFYCQQGPTVGAPTENNFVKGASFSPDGTCLLTSSDDAVLRVFEVPSFALQGENHGTPSIPNEDSGSSATPCGDEDWNPCLYSVEGEMIYDFAWYPHMSSAEPATSVFVSTSRDHPLHLWDAFTGSLRATYRAYDHLDEVVAANSVCFNTNGDKIFAGYNRMIRVFDVAQPGRSCEARPTSKTRKSKSGQRGIISALAFSPDTSGGGLFAAGSYAKTICLYSANSRGHAVAELATTTMGGVTHLEFAPDGRLLFSGSRKDDEIVCWDIRRTKEALHTFERQGATNQRIAFDIDSSGRYLATGSTERRALVYDIDSGALVGSLDDLADAVGSVCFHPSAALLAVCTGQRHFDLDTDDESDSDDCLGVADGAKQDDSARRALRPPTRLQNSVTAYGIGNLTPGNRWDSY